MKIELPKQKCGHLISEGDVFVDFSYGEPRVYLLVYSDYKDSDVEYKLIPTESISNDKYMDVSVTKKQIKELLVEGKLTHYSSKEYKLVLQPIE